MIKRRFLAYVYDWCILTLVLLFTGLILPTTERSKEISDELSKLEKSYLENEISDIKFANEYADLYYEMDKENVPYAMVNVIYILIFFIIIPLKNNGMTIGGSKLGVKIKKKRGKLQSNDLILRNFIINGLLYSMIMLLLVFFVPKSIYFYVATILGFIQFLLVFISAFMVLYRHDQKGLQDLWTKTYVEEVK